LTFEEMHRLLVLERGSARSKRSEIPSAAGRRISFSGIQPVSTGTELANHP